jgi:hypothetical protein
LAWAVVVGATAAWVCPVLSCGAAQAPTATASKATRATRMRMDRDPIRLDGNAPNALIGFHACAGRALP